MFLTFSSSLPPLLSSLIAQWRERAERMPPDVRYEVELCVKELLAALRSLCSGETPQGWRSIDSAPKDGRFVLLYACAFKRHWFGRGYYFQGVPGDGEGWIAHSFYTMPVNDSSGSFTPTHWQPMPLPPVPRETP